MRRRGFTLIELLVVIAIIGILAAMLFPVFARARESARKTQCLANVKNIAMAIKMYLTDYDTLPAERAPERGARLLRGRPRAGDVSNCNTGGDYDEAQWAADVANPYLQWPVLLDDYVKNRDVWKCPSAKIESPARASSTTTAGTGCSTCRTTRPAGAWTASARLHPHAFPRRLGRRGDRLLPSAHAGGAATRATCRSTPKASSCRASGRRRRICRM